MRIITISREFGSGGRELGKRLADMLGYDYYDNEIISAVAKDCGMDAEYVSRVFENHGWQSQKLTFCGTLGSSYYKSSNVSLLLSQKNVIEKIAALNKNFVIVGRNADVILKDYHPFNIFVCATAEAKIKRCIKRSPEGENLTEKELRRKIKQIDKNRAYTREIIGGSDWGRRDSYHITINTTDWEIKDLVPAVADFAVSRFGGEE